MKKFTDFVFDREGNCVVGAEVYVKKQSDETLKTIYSDNGVTEIANPLVTDNDGMFEFYTSDDVIYLEVFVDGALEQTVDNIQHYDDLDNEIAALRSVTSAADTLFYFTGSGSGSVTTLTAFIRTLLDDADAATARATLGAAATSQTAEQISGFIASPSDKSYTLVVKMAHAGTITETTTISASGTCTATFKVNSTALGGTANSVSSAEESQAHASTNTFVAGDDIVLTVSSNSTCADMSFTIKYTRTLA